MILIFETSLKHYVLEKFFFASNRKKRYEKIIYSYNIV